MLNFALEYRAVLDRITDRTRLGLGAYSVGEEEWTLAKQLQDILKILKHVTTFFSWSTPHLAMVIPAMDYIDTLFTKGIINVGTESKQTLDLAIRATLGLAGKMLHHYYSLADSSEVYHIGMGGCKAQPHKWHINS
ncbi:hypothetical protein BV22DRAFT_1023798 [Leucogyrophana mollusca]|uniref:Uncharacterized protein n=1 Tax=Leucogyrophana mollusca TaxID=85980 RepID=A0ACB8B0M5_9AGAM|nr:hypothetical protein BV22DRAFT_1023798 [Leucogyrophana mollusca]